MKKITLLFAVLFSIAAVGQECSVYLTPFTGFVAHDTNKSTHISIHRSFEQGEELATNLEVFYTVSGDTNETNLTSGSVIIPIGVAKVDIEVLPINAPNTTAADRQITITLTPNPNYTIAFEYNRSYGIATIDIKDKEPLKAFPTAYGGGAYSKGGRGGNVYHVTNLKGDNSVGSFRWALGQPRPATIVFDVSGIISIPYNLNIDGNNLTVAGQTAPEGGITLTMPPTNLNIGMDDAEDVIIRYLTIRDQFYYSGAFNVHPGYDFDFVGDTATKNVMFDHMSLSWAGTSLFNIRGRETYNMTFQHGMMGEGTRGSLFGDTGYTGFSYNLTMRNSVFYHVSHRTPNSSGQNSDIYNNVVFEWSQRLTVAKDGSNINYFNNYIFKGNKTALENQWGTKSVNGITLVREGARVNVFSDGNIVQGLFDSRTDDEINLWMRHAGWDIPSELWQKTRPNTNLFQANPHPYIGVAPSTFLTAEQAKDAVPKDAGNYKYIKNDGTVGIYRDVTDARYLNEIENDIRTTWSAGGSTIQDGRHTARDTQEFADFVAASTSENPINSRPQNFYNSAKSEHIPEVWFDANVPNGQNHNDIAPSGYTWLEEYMNQVDNVETEVLAFPTAYGAAAFTTGGRGYPVYKVTNLNTSGSGSFTEALNNAKSNGGGNIVFDVSGTIYYTTANIWQDLENISILGQTAPQGGITFTNVAQSFARTQIIYANNVIIRHIKFRHEWLQDANDAVDIISSENLILDHVSISYGGDEGVSTRVFGDGNGGWLPNKNITLQRTLIGESKTGSILGSTVANPEASDSISVIKNAYFNVSHRHPNIISDGRVDIFNNVVYDWSARLSNFFGDAKVNHIGNYFGLGQRPAFNITPDGTNKQLQMIANDNVGDNLQIYTAGNYLDKDVFTNLSADNKILFYQWGSADNYAQTTPASSSSFTETPFAQLGRSLPIQTATNSFDDVMADVGANAYLDNLGSPQRFSDNFDTDYITIMSTGGFEDYRADNGDLLYTSQPRYAAYHNNISSTPINTRPANYDANNDGINDTWFNANVPSGQTATDLAPSGYTWLENYVNQVDSATPTPTVTEPEEQIVYPENLAFPTALGGGANSRSTDDYSIYEVTNLNSVGPGSLWEGMRQSNTIIVFRVGGIISMNEPEQTSFSNGSSNIIVLGQTAPYPGITVVGNGFKYVSGENIIMRYMRFRQWRCRTELHAPCSADVIDHIDSNNIIYDHCSFAYGGDESLSTRGSSTNFTLSNSIVSYGLSGGLFGDSSDYTLGDNYSSIGNLWHTVGKRTPNPNGNGRFDILGNVTYNILNLAMRTGGDVQLNEIGNYYKYTLRSHMATAQTPSIYTANNRSTQYNLTANNQDNEIIWQDRDNNTGTAIAQYFTDTMHPLLNYDIPLIDGDAAYLRVTNREMGANKYLNNSGNPVTYIDDLDIAAFTEFDNDTRFDWKDSTGLVSSNPNNRSQVNYRVIPQRSWLTDNEQFFGIIINEHSQLTHTGVVPNVWITAKGLNPSTFDPLGNDLNATYTNIEMYSFGVDGITSTSTTVGLNSVNLQGTATSGNIGDTIQLTVTFNPSNATNQAGNYGSSNGSVATVNQSGLVTLTGLGSTTIAYTADEGNGSITATYVIQVLEDNTTTPPPTPTPINGARSRISKLKLIHN